MSASATDVGERGGRNASDSELGDDGDASRDDVVGGVVGSGGVVVSAVVAVVAVAAVAAVVAVVAVVGAVAVVVAVSAVVAVVVAVATVAVVVVVVVVAVVSVPCAGTEEVGVSGVVEVDVEVGEGMK